MRRRAAQNSTPTHSRGDRAFELMRGAIADGQIAEEGMAPPAGPWLVIDDLGAPVVEALKAAGAQATCWRRRALGEQPEALTPWPPAGPFAAVALRLCRSRQELAMSIELAAARLMPGGTIWLYGANDEGAKSAGKALSPWFEAVATLDTRAHCRLWWGRARQDLDPGPQGELASWAATDAVALPGGEAQVISYPGCFADGALDPGTALLIQGLEALKASLSEAGAPLPERALDFCCGPGVSGLGARQIFGLGLALSAVDYDALAAHAAAQSLPGAEVAVGDGWAGVQALRGEPRFDLILSNPPIHRGKALDMSVVEQLIAEAPKALKPKGHLIFVIQRQRPVAEVLERHFHTARCLIEDGRFRVWLARKA